MSASPAIPAPQIKRRGLMLVLSSPSGAGKTSIARRLLEVEPELRLSISVTTRPRRPSEVDGADYHFIGRSSYLAMIEAGDLLEHAEVYGHGYGTPRGPVEEALAAGRDVLFDIDWQGTQQLREARTDMVSVFILPPSMPELERRLRRRAEDVEEVVRRRLNQVGADVTHFAEYDYVLINSDFAQSVARVREILAAERLRTHRQSGLSEFVNQFRTSA